MSKAEKIIEQMRRSPQNVRFDDLAKICTDHFGKPRRDLTADLPAAQQQPPRPGMVLDQRLLIILLCIHPPAALIYWLLCRNRQAGSGEERGE